MDSSTSEEGSWNSSPPSISSSSSTSRPILTLSLGIGLLVVLVICLSGIFSICYQWNRFLSVIFPHHHSPPPPPNHSGDVIPALSRNHQPLTPSASSQPHETMLNCKEEGKADDDSSVPIMMPGDQFPKFVALPCPIASPSQPENDFN